MSNLNLEKVKEVLKNGKKMALKATAPVALAASIVFSSGTTANAATVVFPETFVVSNDEETYVVENNYTSFNVSDQEVSQVNKIMAEIDEKYDSIYQLLANGGMKINYTGSKKNSMGRLFVIVQEIENAYKTNNMSYASSNVIKRYINTKKEEVKLIFSNMIGISISEINDFANNYTCTFVESIGSKNTTNIGIYKMQNNQIISSDIVSFNDSKLSTTNTIVKMPKINVSYENEYTAVPTFRKTYTGSVISKKNVEVYNEAVEEIDALYLKIENAIKKGNYTKQYSQRDEDVFTAIYGDTNYINDSILKKYEKYTSITSLLKQYIKYCQTNVISQVYNKNMYTITNYANYISYANNNKPVRVSEEAGFVYYKVGNTYYIIIDKNNIKTEDLKVTGVVESNELTTANIKISKGINIYVDNQLYVPKKSNGNALTPFIYNGITYLPVRQIAKLFGATATWNSASSTVEITAENSGEYYIDGSGNKVYISNLPSVPTTSEKPSKKITKKTIEALKGVQIVFNGEAYTPKNSSGKEIDVYRISGVTYVPAVAIIDMFGADIRWDGSNYSVMINRSGYSYENPSKEDTVVSESKAYYIDPTTGKKVYIEEDEYTHTR